MQSLIPSKAARKFFKSRSKRKPSESERSQSVEDNEAFDDLSTGSDNVSSWSYRDYEWNGKSDESLFTKGSDDEEAKEDKKVDGLGVFGLPKRRPIPKPTFTKLNLRSRLLRGISDSSGRSSQASERTDFSSRSSGHSKKKSEQVKNNLDISIDEDDIMGDIPPPDSAERYKDQGKRQSLSPVKKSKRQESDLGSVGDDITVTSTASSKMSRRSKQSKEELCFSLEEEDIMGDIPPPKVDKEGQKSDDAGSVGSRKKRNGSMQKKAKLKKKKKKRQSSPKEGTAATRLLDSSPSDHSTSRRKRRSKESDTADVRETGYSSDGALQANKKKIRERRKQSLHKPTKQRSLSPKPKSKSDVPKSLHTGDLLSQSKVSDTADDAGVGETGYSSDGALQANKKKIRERRKQSLDGPTQRRSLSPKPKSKSDVPKSLHTGDLLSQSKVSDTADDASVGGTGYSSDGALQATKKKLRERRKQSLDRPTQRRSLSPKPKSKSDVPKSLRTGDMLSQSEHRPKTPYSSLVHTSPSANQEKRQRGGKRNKRPQSPNNSVASFASGENLSKSDHRPPTSQEVGTAETIRSTTATLMELHLQRRRADEEELKELEEARAQWEEAYKSLETEAELLMMDHEKVENRLVKEIRRRRDLEDEVEELHTRLRAAKVVDAAPTRHDADLQRVEAEFEQERQSWACRMEEKDSRITELERILALQSAEKEEAKSLDHSEMEQRLRRKESHLDEREASIQKEAERVEQLKSRNGDHNVADLEERIGLVQQEKRIMESDMQQERLDMEERMKKKDEAIEFFQNELFLLKAHHGASPTSTRGGRRGSLGIAGTQNESSHGKAMSNLSALVSPWGRPKARLPKNLSMPKLALEQS